MQKSIPCGYFRAAANHQNRHAGLPLPARERQRTHNVRRSRTTYYYSEEGMPVAGHVQSGGLSLGYTGVTHNRRMLNGKEAIHTAPSEFDCVIITSRKVVESFSSRRAASTSRQRKDQQRQRHNPQRRSGPPSGSSLS